MGRKQAETTSGGESAILFELYRIATQRQDSARAKDLLDSALQAADQDGGEALRLEEALKQAGHWDLLLNSLQRRLARTTDGHERMAILRARAEALIALGRNDDALDILFELVANNPTESSVLDQTEQFSRAAGQRHGLRKHASISRTGSKQRTTKLGRVNSGFVLAVARRNAETSRKLQTTSNAPKRPACSRKRRSSRCAVCWK